MLDGGSRNENRAPRAPANLRVLSDAVWVDAGRRIPSGYDLRGLELLMRTVSKVRERYNPGLRLAGVLLGNYDRTASLDKDIHQMLGKRFGEEVVFKTTIGRSVRMRDATVRGQTIFELPEAQGQAQQFLTLIHEMLNRGSKRPEQTLNPLPSEKVFGAVANG